ncbi:MAG: HIT domain-containing protein [Planctomycetota bacterium]
MTLSEPDTGSEGFAVDPKLLADSHRLGALDDIELLLHRDAGVPWFILVPVTDCMQFLDLDEERQQVILTLARSLARFNAEVMGYPKANLAALGNVVAQLHVHVVGRRPGDPCWPQPVWGNLKSGCSYTTERLRSLESRLSQWLGREPRRGPPR